MRFATRTFSPCRQRRDEEILSRLKQSRKKETLSNFQYAGQYEEPFNKWAKDTRTAAFVGISFFCFVFPNVLYNIAYRDKRL